MKGVNLVQCTVSAMINKEVLKISHRFVETFSYIFHC